MGNNIMQNKLFIIGNGFDLANNLPTRFDPDFKNIAIKYEKESNVMLGAL